MSKLLISYVNDWDAGTVTASSEHPSFPAINTQQRWYKKPWRSKYGAGSSWGLFRITAAKCKIYFDEGGGTLTATLTVGDYDTTTICAEIKAQMETAGTLTYTVTYNDATNLFTIAGSGAFVLELTGTVNAAWNALGWTSGVDTGSAASHDAEEIRIHTEEYIYCNYGSVKTIEDLIIKNHNLQSTAIVTACYYSDAFITLVATDVFTWHAETIGQRVSRSYQYVAYKIEDPDNPDGFVEIGRAWAGSEFIPYYGFNPEHSSERKDPSLTSSSDDGQESSVRRSHYREWDYAFDAITPADRITFATMFSVVGNTLPFFIVEAPAADDIGTTAQYVKFMEWPEDHLAGAYWKMKLSVRSER